MKEQHSDEWIYSQLKHVLYKQVIHLLVKRDQPRVQITWNSPEINGAQGNIVKIIWQIKTLCKQANENPVQ